MVLDLIYESFMCCAKQHINTLGLTGIYMIRFVCLTEFALVNLNQDLKWGVFFRGLKIQGGENVNKFFLDLSRLWELKLLFMER